MRESVFCDENFDRLARIKCSDQAWLDAFVARLRVEARAPEGWVLFRQKLLSELKGRDIPRGYNPEQVAIDGDE